MSINRPQFSKSVRRRARAFKQHIENDTEYNRNSPEYKIYLAALIQLPELFDAEDDEPDNETENTRRIEDTTLARLSQYGKDIPISKDGGLKLLLGALANIQPYGTAMGNPRLNRRDRPLPGSLPTPIDSPVLNGRTASSLSIYQEGRYPGLNNDYFSAKLKSSNRHASPIRSTGLLTPDDFSDTDDISTIGHAAERNSNSVPYRSARRASPLSITQSSASDSLSAGEDVGRRTTCNDIYQPRQTRLTSTPRLSSPGLGISIESAPPGISSYLFRPFSRTGPQMGDEQAARLPPHGPRTPSTPTSPLAQTTLIQLPEDGCPSTIPNPYPTPPIPGTPEQVRISEHKKARGARTMMTPPYDGVNAKSRLDVAPSLPDRMHETACKELVAIAGPGDDDSVKVGRYDPSHPDASRLSHARSPYAVYASMLESVERLHFYRQAAKHFVGRGSGRRVARNGKFLHVRGAPQISLAQEKSKMYKEQERNKRKRTQKRLVLIHRAVSMPVTGGLQFN